MAINDAIALALKNFNGALNDKLYAFWKALAAGYLSGGGVVGVKAPGVLAQSGGPISITGTLVETTLATIAIPASSLTTNGSLRITTLWSYTNSANTKTVRVRLAGTQIGLAAATATAAVQGQVIITNRAALNSQVCNGNNMAAPFGTTTSAPVITAIDMAVSQNVTLTATLSNVGETITLESYTVEILNP